MSDDTPDEPEEHQPFPPLPFGIPLGANFISGSPEEVTAQLREHQTKLEMTFEADVHARLNFMESLDRPTLEYVKSLVHHISSCDLNGSPASEAASYYDGLFTSLLWMKHHVCPSCQVVHEEQLLTEGETNTEVVKPDEGKTESDN